MRLAAVPATGLAIVIPFYLPDDPTYAARWVALQSTVASVLDQMYDVDYLVLVDDGGQGRIYLDWIGKLLHDHPNMGLVNNAPAVEPPWRLASSRNYGVDTAVVDADNELDAYIFLDADCIPAPWWLSAYREAVDNYIATAAPYPGLVLFGRTDHERVDGTVMPDPRISDPHGDEPFRAACLLERGGGGNMLVTRDIFEDIGGFDEAYDGGFGYEETDLAVRAYEAGAEVMYHPRAQVVHKYHPRDKDHFRNLDRNRQMFQARTRLFAGTRG